MASLAIKQELFDCGSKSNTSINSNLKFSVPYGASDVISISMNTNSSPKMGSRRIFTPQFKLQVLESYRNDSDCKGNQRATARKYNIHRRQIQKWLQCESNLRSSVANINQSNVKHQFHNICHDHHYHNHQQKQNMTITTRNKHNTYGHNQRPLHHQLSLDTARQRVALNLPAVPALILQNSSTISTPEVSVMSNLAPVIVNSADAMTLVPTQSSSGKSTAISLVRPTAIGGSNGTIHKSMLHTYHHYDQYSMPYTHTPASIPVSVPTITHSSPPQLHNHYQYQNLTHHSNSLTHEQHSSLYLPSTSLPVIVLSAAASSVTTTKYEIEHWKTTAMQREEIKKCDELRPLKCAAPTVLTQAAGNNDEYVQKSLDHIKTVCIKDVNKIHRKCELQKQIFSLHPIDLSLGQRHRFEENITAIKSYSDNRYKPCSIEVGHSKPLEKQDLVVDLTFRKRKAISNAVVNKQREKKSKNENSEIFSCNIHEKKDEEHKDVELDLGQKTSTQKPIKLFKPYLLHTEDKIKPVRDNEVCNPIMWSHHPDCFCPNSYDKCEHSHQNSFFQSPLMEKYSFHAESFNLYSNKITLNQSSVSPQSPSQLSPEGLRCPKGSPVSGYESSSSTYSDLSFKEAYRKNCTTKAYSIDVELHPIFNNNLILNENNIKKWLDQEYTNSPRSPSPTIAVYL